MSLHDPCSIFFPYFLGKEKDGSYVLFNREYTPVGFHHSHGFAPDDYPFVKASLRITPKKFEFLAKDDYRSNDSRSIEWFYLYSDLTSPLSSKEAMNNYLEKLRVLMKLDLNGPPVWTDVRWAYFPYSIQRQEDGSWVLLNRGYKPVGFNTSDYINYNEYPVNVFLRITPHKYNLLLDDRIAVGNRSDYNEGYISLYDDATAPTRTKENMDRYLEKLRVIMKLKIKKGFEHPCWRDLR